jgi:hypothetical protein
MISIYQTIQVMQWLKPDRLRSTRRINWLSIYGAAPGTLNSRAKPRNNAEVFAPDCSSLHLLHENQSPKIECLKRELTLPLLLPIPLS